MDSKKAVFFSPIIDELIEAFCCLPGVGPKSAQRMTFHLLQRQRERGAHLSRCLQQAMDNIGHCQQCRSFCEAELCSVCQDNSRNLKQLCIVETPADVVAIEQTHVYRGYYFVLHGHLSPLDGIGPREVGMDKLETRLQLGDVSELIIATNTTIEGEATAHYIANLAKEHQVNASRIAHGVPLGGELEFVDGGTIARAMQYRQVI